jgi:hypothetical protein
MKIISVFIIVGLLITGTTAVQAKKVATLAEILKPDTAAVTNDRIFIAQGTSVFIYSLKDFRLIKKFGKEGEGPGEFKIIPFSKMIVHPYNNDGKVYISSFAKLSIFSEDGEFIKESKITPFAVFRPFQDMFLATASISNEKDQSVVAVNLYNEKFEKVKELYITDMQVGESLTLDFPVNAFTFPSYRDRVYVAIGKEGMVIDVFDKKGTKLYRIKKDYNPEKVTEEYKKKTLDWFKYDPLYKDFWDFLKKRITFKTHYPAINRIFAADDRIYLVTYKKQGKDTLCIIMDLKGNEEKRIYLPCPDIIGMDYLPRYDFYNRTFYCLVENEEDDLWELHMTKIDKQNSK